MINGAFLKKYHLFKKILNDKQPKTAHSAEKVSKTQIVQCKKRKLVITFAHGNLMQRMESASQMKDRKRNLSEIFKN